MVQPTTKSSNDLKKHMTSELTKVIIFLESIGLTVKIHVGAHGFLDGVRIEQGILLVDPACKTSSLLHEAGHISCVPSRFRGYMSDDLDHGITRMLDEVRELGLEADHPLERAALQCSDVEATAWAWAAGNQIGLEPEQIIQDDEYEGDGAEIRLMLQSKRYLGINGLARSGMCRFGRWYPPEMCYPNMILWLQNV